jgi:hypothetical protein
MDAASVRTQRESRVCSVLLVVGVLIADYTSSMYPREPFTFDQTTPVQHRPSAAHQCRPLHDGGNLVHRHGPWCACSCFDGDGCH